MSLKRTIASETCRGTWLPLVVIALSLMMLSFTGKLNAQPRIAYIQPDEAAAGMTIALEILAPNSPIPSFGTDGLAVKGTQVVLLNPKDSNRVMLGPPV